MFVYISGPYSPPINELDPVRRRQIIEENIQQANKVAIRLAQEGYFPFTPHTMMHGWEDKYNISHELTMRNCLKWLEKCDALFFINSSPGANLEREHAWSHNIPVVYSYAELEKLRAERNQYRGKDKSDEYEFTFSHSTSQ
ncbi:MAG: hypothetical protein NVS4B7_10150 [Ktedonobacteraceae bacterium]